MVQSDREEGKGGKGGKGSQGHHHHSGAGWTSNGTYIGCFALSSADQSTAMNDGSNYNCNYAIYGYGQTGSDMYSSSSSGGRR